VIVPIATDGDEISAFGSIRVEAECSRKRLFVACSTAVNIMGITPLSQILSVFCLFPFSSTVSSRMPQFWTCTEWVALPMSAHESVHIWLRNCSQHRINRRKHKMPYFSWNNGVIVIFGAYSAPSFDVWLSIT